VFPSADHYLPLLNIVFYIILQSTEKKEKKRRKEKKEKGERGGVKLQVTCSTLILNTV